MVTHPYRIAFVRPDLRTSADVARRNHASLVLFHHLFERCVRHPTIALDPPSASKTLVHDGAFVPAASSSGVVHGAFERDRRDEILWLEASLDEPEPVRLHSVRPGDRRETFSALGGPERLGERIDRVLSLWLTARGLPASSGEASFSTAELFSAIDGIGPLLKEAIRRREDPPKGDGEDAATDVDERVDLPSLADLPPSLQVPALRACGVCLGVAVRDRILAVDPGNPWALLEAFEASLRDGADFSLLRRAIANAPNFGRLHRAMLVPDELEGVALPEKPTPFEEVAFSGFATVCSPSDTEARSTHGARLARLGRKEERVRVAERTRDESVYHPAAWLPLLEAYDGLEAVGRFRRTAGIGANTVGLVVGGQIRPWNRWSMSVDLHASRSLLAVGLLGEAITLRANRLEGLETRYRSARAVLEGWRKEPRHVAWAYAREGYFRGEDARVLEGFSRAEPSDGIDLGMFIESLVVCGRAPEALLAFAHLGHGRRLATPFAQRAAVRAYLATGRFVDGFTERLRLMLTAPHRPYAAALDRMARGLALAPLSELEEVVRNHVQRGAHTLARLAAREIADFVPGAHRCEAITEALGRRAPTTYSTRWLDPFGDVPSRDAIDTFFAGHEGGPSLEEADRLVELWPDVRFTQVDPDDRPGVARTTVALFAQALGRYLCATTSAPSVWAGGLRTVANEALLALSNVREDLTEADVRALLCSLEAPMASADPWLSDTWLLRIERALRLEERVHGRLSALASDAPWIADHLRGPERVAIETMEAARLLREKPADYGGRARPLLERLLRSAGASAADGLVEAGVVGSRDDTDALDVAMTAAFVSEGSSALPSVRAAGLLFRRGEAELAFETLCAGLGAFATEAWRDEQLSALESLWKESDLDVPFDFGPGAQEGIAALQHGDAARGERILRWLVALDPDNAEAHRNLGIAYAMQAKVEPALTHFARATRDQDTQFLSGVLFQSGHPEQAMRILDYASRWYTRAEQWINFGAIAFQVMDNPRTVQAYAHGWELDPEVFDASNLNSYAGVLDEVGDYATCEKIARRLLDTGEGDPLWTSNAWHHLACAWIGQGKLDDAATAAERAIADNPLPDNEEVFAQTLGRARTGERPPVPPPLPDPVPRHRAFVDLEGGDVKAVVADHAEDASHAARLAVLRASRFRFGSENYVRVPTAAKDVAARLIRDTRGTADPGHALCRELALEVREQASFPSDPPPMLGDRGTRDEFYREFRERGGIIVGDPPVEQVPFIDREVCPGTPLPRASDYVRVLKALARRNPMEALTAEGLDLDTFEVAAQAWGSALRHDPALGDLLAAGMST